MSDTTKKIKIPLLPRYVELTVPILAGMLSGRHLDKIPILFGIGLIIWLVTEDTWRRYHMIVKLQKQTGKNSENASELTLYRGMFILGPLLSSAIVTMVATRYAIFGEFLEGFSMRMFVSSGICVNICRLYNESLLTNPQPEESPENTSAGDSTLPAAVSPQTPCIPFETFMQKISQETDSKLASLQHTIKVCDKAQRKLEKECERQFQLTKETLSDIISRMDEKYFSNILNN